MSEKFVALAINNELNKRISYLCKKAAYQVFNNLHISIGM